MMIKKSSKTYAKVGEIDVRGNPDKTGFLFLPEKGDLFYIVGEMIFFREIRYASLNPFKKIKKSNGFTITKNADRFLYSFVYALQLYGTKYIQRQPET